MLPKFFRKLLLKTIQSCVDAEPELASDLLAAIREISDPESALKELTLMLKGFDEGGTGTVGQRAFLIACSRGR